MSLKAAISLICLSLAALAVPMEAMTYVMMQDGDLADAAPVIAEVEVVESGFSAASGIPSTDYQVRVRRVVKGSIIGSTLVVRVPGGLAPDGLSLMIHGAPSLVPGEKALLFLTPRQDGAYGLVQLGLGTFHMVESGGKMLALRDLRGGQAFTVSGEPDGGADHLRHAGRFADWLASRSAGQQRATDYLLTPADAGLDSAADAFTLLRDSVSGLPSRWPIFTEGEHVTFFAHVDGQPGLPGGGTEEFQTALALWTSNSATNVDYRFGGTTTATGGLSFPFDDGDLVNTILFDDPNSNLLFGGPFDCSPGGGGVIAIGGPWFDRTVTHMHEGTVFIDTVAADIITNKNAGCFLASRSAASEVFAHELGHTLGLGHSCGDSGSGICQPGTPKDDALMRAFAHGDGRGAQFSSDDRAGIASIYGIEGGGDCPTGSASTALCLHDGRFKVEGIWRRPNDAMGVATGASLSPSAGYFWFFNDSNVEMMVKIHDGCGKNGNFWVFAGGMTNVEVELTVTDTVSGMEKIYRNPQGSPFRPIQDTAAFACF